MKGRNYTWSGGETLLELIARRDEIMASHEAALQREAKALPNLPLVDVLAGALDEDDDKMPCTVCAI